MKQLNIAIVGATGLVGRHILTILKQRNYPIGRLFLFASKNSAGQSLYFGNNAYIVKDIETQKIPKNVDIAIFSAGAKVSSIYAKRFVKENAVVIDNSSFWRMHTDVPLVVPEVNAIDIQNHKGIIANPNCSTIQAVVALAPLHNKFKIKRIVYNTFQAVSGAGKAGIKDLEQNALGEKPSKFTKNIANNIIPQVDLFEDTKYIGYTKEEIKMIEETRKILHSDDIQITATCTRVPVFNSHSESINVEFKEEFCIENIANILDNAPGVHLIKQPDYPTPMEADGIDCVLVGRVRRDFSVKNGINIWVCADNLRKGAATNAVQIAEHLLLEVQ